MRKFLVGSNYFFSQYNDFIIHDTDYVRILKSNKFKYRMYVRSYPGQDLVLLQDMPLEERIEHDVNSCLATNVGQYLIPEFNEYVGFKFEDLPKIECQIKRLDKKHEYQAIIYYAYLKNGNFTLTDEQRLEAYNNYRAARGLEEHKTTGDR